MSFNKAKHSLIRNIFQIDQTSDRVRFLGVLIDSRLYLFIKVT